MTRAPVVAKARVTARPIPPAAPVTITPRPSRPAPTLHATAMSSSAGFGCPSRAGSAPEDLLTSIAIDDLLLDVDTQARLGRRIEPTVTVLDGLRHEFVLHRVA